MKLRLNSVKNRRLGWLLALLLIPVLACSLLVETTPAPTPTEEQPAMLTTQVLPEPTINIPTVSRQASKAEEITPQQDGTSLNQDSNITVVPVTAPEWPAPVSPFIPFERVTVTEDEFAVSTMLEEAAIPPRDDIDLARLYEGWAGELPHITLVEQPLPIGTVEDLNILNHDAITIDPISAELLAVSDHAYFWFDTGPGSFKPSPTTLARIATDFDWIYEQSVALFGPEDNPGVDGDPRVHIVNASPLALCDSIDQCGIAGYFGSSDSIPAAVDPDSNAREMFVMNVEFFGSDFYINVLAHELRHMIEENYDSGDADWEVEGAAMLAEDLLGFRDNAIFRANLFLEKPDQQLNSWTDEGTTPYYGQGYLLNRYIYDRLGQDLYGEFASSPEYGLDAVDTIAQANNLDISGRELWLDWLVALVLHDDQQADEIYRFGISGLDTAAMSDVESFPATFGESVGQYAVDYYAIEGDGQVSIRFNGSALVPLIDTMPASGQWMWLSNRANYSHATLTRKVDLTGVDAASLDYQVYHDIESGYDFAYVFVSQDEGLTWEPLEAENMATPDRDPSESALAERFYTDRSEEWLSEQIDLTPFTGQEILIRFAYITDPILTRGGIAIDNIAIPEIGFYDDLETPQEGWSGLGFERVTAVIPQQWHLTLVTYPGGVPAVERLSLAEDQHLSEIIDLDDGGGRAILIVAASAPVTLQPAHYKLVFER